MWHLNVTQNDMKLQSYGAFDLIVHFHYFLLQRVNKSSSEMELKIKYAPISLGKLRIWSSVHHSLKSMKDLGTEVMILLPFWGNIILTYCYTNNTFECIYELTKWEVRVAGEVHVVVAHKHAKRAISSHLDYTNPT